MLSLATPCRRRSRALPTLLVALALVTSACSSNDKSTTEPHTSSTAPPSTGTTLPGQSPTPRATAAEAVQVLLAAEQRGDHVTSYRLLSKAGRAQYKDVSEWKQRRSELPPVTSFMLSVNDASQVQGHSARVVVEVRHKPGLDPFIGLSAARERETWTARRVGSRWLVDPDPAVVYELPPSARAASAVVSWARAVQACDKAAATKLQGIPELYGMSDGADRLCRSKGPITAGAVGSVEAGPSSADLLAQYSTDALAWARTVRVRAPRGSFSVIVAPIGEVWKIVGLSD